MNREKGEFVPKTTVNNNNGVGFCSLLFLLFLGLKLTGHIDWSWWWVASPLWIPLALVLSVVAIVLVGAIIIKVVSAFLPRKNN